MKTESAKGSALISSAGCDVSFQLTLHEYVQVTESATESENSSLLNMKIAWLLHKEAKAIDSMLPLGSHSSLARYCLAKSALEQYKVESDCSAVDNRAMNRICGRSIEINSVSLVYDPVIYTIVAALETRAKIYLKPDYVLTKLPYPRNAENKRFYQKGVYSYVSKICESNCNWVVLVNSSFSTVKSGSWTTKIVHMIREISPNTNIMVFSGLLTPEVLESKSPVPPITGRLPAEDLYSRLQHYFTTENSNVEHVGIVGFSGGASIVEWLSFFDNEGDEPDTLFDLGAIAFSPVPDVLKSFDVLDESNRQTLESGFPSSKALTIPIIPDMIVNILRGYTPSRLDKFTELLDEQKAERRDDFKKRFYREFEIVDLKGIADAEYSKNISCDNLSTKNGYYLYYSHCVVKAFGNEFNLLKSATIEELIDRDIELLTSIQRKIAIVGSIDDPVFERIAVGEYGSNGSVNADTQKLVDRFSYGLPIVKGNGSHMGYLTDTEFLHHMITKLLTSSLF